MNTANEFYDWIIQWIETYSTFDPNDKIVFYSLCFRNVAVSTMWKHLWWSNLFFLFLLNFNFSPAIWCFIGIETQKKTLKIDWISWIHLIWIAFWFGSMNEETSWWLILNLWFCFSFAWPASDEFHTLLALFFIRHTILKSPRYMWNAVCCTFINKYRSFHTICFVFCIHYPYMARTAKEQCSKAK